MKRKNLVLIFLCVVLIVAPFILNKNGEYEGADAKANDLIYQ